MTNTPKIDTSFLTAGHESVRIPVKISYRIIELFSEGLYSSPHKAIEELVSNAFDAGAENVHVVLSADLSATEATIAVLDDGDGMGPSEIQQHWLIGQSNKRDTTFKPPKGRKQIGKFGIGKLATYVLANKLTHITKHGEKFHAATMDYTSVPAGNAIFDERGVQLPVRELSEQEARAALSPWMSGDGPGFKAMKLFGKGASGTWTVAIMSQLKGMATEIQRGRLRWLLESAMPLRDDFALYLNGDIIESKKLRKKRIGRYVLGKDIKELPKPGPDELEVSQDKEAAAVDRFGLFHRSLGRVTGYIEVFKEPLTGGHSDEIAPSNGFFVYVRERLINVDDQGFGIDRNLLRHGTFSRFRMVLRADGLDDELRSSREAIRTGPLTNIARDIAHAGFNFARAELQKAEQGELTSSEVAERVASTPAALTRRPVAALAAAVYRQKYSPLYFTLPADLSKEDQDSLIESLREGDDVGVVTSTVLTELSQDDGIAKLDVRTRTMHINALHPFVAYFLDEYENPKVNLPLELFAVSEVLIEAQLLEEGWDATRTHEILKRRDALLRSLARSSGRRNALIVAQALEDAASDQHSLEVELVASMDSMGFDAVPIGGSGKPDGLAEAHLGASVDGAPRRYKISLEAKSKEREGQKVTAKSVNVSGVARHRDSPAYQCDHALVVGPDFPTTSKGDSSALAQEIDADRKQTGRTITLMRVHDLARLVKLVPARRLGLDRLRQLFECRLPEEAAKWVNAIEKESRPPSYLKHIVEVIELEQKEETRYAVAFPAIRTRLRLQRNIDLSDQQIREECLAASRVVPGLIDVTQTTVALNTSAAKLLAAFGADIRRFPSETR